MSSTQEVGEIFGAGSGPADAMLRSPTVLIASVGLWGMNVYFFRLFKINYIKVLKHDLMKEKDDKQEKEMTTVPTTSKRNLKISEGNNSDESDDESDDQESEAKNFAITWRRLTAFSLCLFALLHITIYVCMIVFGRSFLEALFFFYVAVSVAILAPIPSLQWLRKATAIVFHRAFELINPRCHCLSPEKSIPRAIPFVDVYFADAMCSLSKVFFDWGMLIHMASHYPNPVPPSPYNILMPSAFAAVPYLIRARQCLVMHSVGRLKNDPKRYQHLMNTAKYCSSIIPICFSAYQKTLSNQDLARRLDRILVFLLAINALYALYWDIVMDWGMMHNPVAAVCVGGSFPTETAAPTCGHKVLRPRLRFGVCISFAILISDSFLRFSWVLRYYSRLFPSADQFTLFTQFLEVFRRALWNLLRIEWENIKHQQAFKQKQEHDLELVKLVDNSTTFKSPKEVSHKKSSLHK